MALIDINTVMQKAGIVGAGGAGFPSYAKLSEAADTLVINCAECESLMYTDFTIMREYMHYLFEASHMLMDNTTINKTVIPIKQHRAELLGYSDGQEISNGIVIKHIPHVYPIGDEINLIYQSTGRIIPPGKLPISKGIIVYNGETMFNTRMAITDDKPVIDKWITIGGDIPEKYVVRAPIGMKVSDLLKTLKIPFKEGHTLLDGGPAMGAVKNINTATITKTTKALLILPDNIKCVTNKKVNIEDMLRRAASACCGCSRCTDMCPRHLLGYPLEPHKMIRVAMTSVAERDPVILSTATLCCSCGVCEEVCCQDISPKDVIMTLKRTLGERKIRYTAKDGEESVPSSDRQYRMISSSKWQDLMGIRSFDGTIPTYIPDTIKASKVEILMSQHIGAPSIPCVSVGDTVSAGQMIAHAGNGLSIPQHASIDGHVTYVDSTRIIIEA